MIGRDGKEYPRTRRTEPPAALCSTCGEHHPEQTGDCPWDLFAQGLAPHPHGGPVPEASAGEETTYGTPQMPDPHAAGPNRENVATPRVTDAEPTDNVSRPPVLETLTGLVGQLEAVLEEVSGLGDVVRAIEDATADLSADHWDFASKAGSAGSAISWNRRRPVGLASWSGWGWWPTRSARAHDRERAGRG